MQKATLEDETRTHDKISSLSHVRFKLMSIPKPDNDASFDQKKAQTDQNDPTVLIVIGVDDTPGTN